MWRRPIASLMVPWSWSHGLSTAAMSLSRLRTLSGFVSSAERFDTERISHDAFLVTGGRGFPKDKDSDIALSRFHGVYASGRLPSPRGGNPGLRREL